MSLFRLRIHHNPNSGSLSARTRTGVLLALILTSGPALAVTADSPQAFLARFAAEAKAIQPGFIGTHAFSAERGRRFYTTAATGEWSCATCHTDNPAATGKHKVTAKPIDPLAPSIQKDRFTRADKVDKWFKRNCNDVLKRECTPQEKGDLLAYLLTIKP